jgi:hypothetical protein
MTMNRFAGRGKNHACNDNPAGKQSRGVFSRKRNRYFAASTSDVNG